VRGVRVNSGTGDRLIGVSVRSVRVNIYLGLVLWVRAIETVTAVAFRGRILP
jgi:hypothetical protein